MTQAQSKIQLRSAVEVQQWLINWLAQEVNVNQNEIDLQEPFVNFGLSSRQAVILAGDLEDWVGITLEPSLAWDYPTIEQLAEFVASTTNA
jgi:acyl carrier protein